MIEVKNLTKRYGTNTALNNVSFTVEEGTIVGFLGPNGAGKSTTMNIITGYLSATSGSVTVQGKNTLENPNEVKKLIGQRPIFGICLGHQLMALANGADTEKLKYGHRGANHPVKDLSTGRVYISSQNHGYVVDVDKLDPSIATPAFVNVNDGTNEGLKYTGKNIFTVQFHPEACPGPQDSGYLFDRFIEMMGGDQ